MLNEYKDHINYITNIIRENQSKIATLPRQSSNTLNEFLLQTLDEINCDDLTILYEDAIINNSGVKSIILRNAVTIGNNNFSRCKNLQVIDLPEAVTFNEYVGQQTNKLVELRVPKLQSMGYYCFAGMGLGLDYGTSLKKIDLPSISFIGNRCFRASDLSTLILRREDVVCSLDGDQAFLSTPIAEGTGYIYVPSSLIEQYKTAEYWSAFASQFRALEDFTVDGTVTGELDDEKVAAANGGTSTPPPPPK